MKWKNKISLQLLAMAIFCCCLIACTPQNSEEKCIKQMLTKWSDQQSEYLQEAFINGISVIGPGQPKNSDTAAEELKEAIDKEYGEYFTEKGLDIFTGNLLVVSLLAQDVEMLLEIENLEVVKDNEYKFDCDIKCTKDGDTEGKTIHISGKINFKDDKINWLKMSDIEELTTYINTFNPLSSHSFY